MTVASSVALTSVAKSSAIDQKLAAYRAGGNSPSVPGVVSAQARQRGDSFNLTHLPRRAPQRPRPH